MSPLPPRTCWLCVAGGRVRSLRQAGRRIWPWRGRALAPALAVGAEHGRAVAGSGRRGVEWWTVNRRTCHISATPPATCLARWQGASGWRKNRRRMALAGTGEAQLRQGQFRHCARRNPPPYAGTRHPTPAPATKRSMCVRPVWGGQCAWMGPPVTRHFRAAHCGTTTWPG